jgi:hypothetical protein
MPAINRPRFYAIEVEGHLDDSRSHWFDDLTVIRNEDGNTTLSGPLADQAALHGVLVKVRNLGLVLLAVNRPEYPGS